MAQQLRWPSQLPLLLRICHLCYPDGSISDCSISHTNSRLHESTKHLIWSSDQPLSRALCNGYIRRLCGPLPLCSNELPYLSYGSRRNNTRISQFAQVHQKRTSQSLHSRQYFQKPCCNTIQAAATNIYAFQEEISGRRPEVRREKNQGVKEDCLLLGWERDPVAGVVRFPGSNGVEQRAGLKDTVF